MVHKSKTSVQTRAWSQIGKRAAPASRNPGERRLNRASLSHVPGACSTWTGIWLPWCFVGLCDIWLIVNIQGLFFLVSNSLWFSWEILKNADLEHLCVSVVVCPWKTCWQKHLAWIPDCGTSALEIPWDQGFLLSPHLCPTILNSCPIIEKALDFWALSCDWFGEPQCLSLSFFICRWGRLIELWLPSKTIPRVA